jgi:hypothetical protein
MNTFELRFFIDPIPPEQIEDEEDEIELVYQEIWIDGQHIEESHAVDLRQLFLSLSQAGEFFIFTCGCGIAGCASILKGVVVEHELDNVHWRFFSPVSSKNFTSKKKWLNKAKQVEYIFDKKQMVANINAAFENIRTQITTRTAYSPYGFEREDFDNLRPNY